MYSARRRRMLPALALATALGLVVTGCGQGSSQSSAPAKTDTLVIDQAFTAQSIDPATIFQVTDAIVGTGVYQTLLGYEGGVADPQPLLASSFEVSKDSKTFTFTLDAKAVFADGTKVSADDVEFSLMRLKNLNSSPAYLMEGLSVQAKGEDTVVITSETPAPYLPQILTSPATSIVEADAVRKAGGSDAKDAATADKAGALFTQASNGVGSGPYQLESYDAQAKITLVRNEKYWGEKPVYERIVLRNVTKAQQQKSNVESGESQIALDIPGRIADSIKNANLNVKSSPSPEVLYLGISEDPSSPTSNEKVREAIRIGLDYEQLLTLAGPGSQRAAGIIPSKLIGAIPKDEAVATDVEKAKALIAESGIGQQEITFDYANDYTRLAGLDYNVLAQGIQSQLKALGLNVKLNPTPSSTSLQRYIDGKAQLTMWSWPPDYADPDNLMVFSAGNLIGKRLKWDASTAPEVVAAAKAARESTGDARAAAFEKWNRAVAEQGPYAFLLEPSVYIVSSTSVSRVEHDPMATVNLAQIR